MSNEAIPPSGESSTVMPLLSLNRVRKIILIDAVSQPRKLLTRKHLRKVSVTNYHSRPLILITALSV